MLSLSRLVGETTIITTADGTEIAIRIACVQGKKVRMQFKAPLSARIRRGELPPMEAEKESVK